MNFQIKRVGLMVAIIVAVCFLGAASLEANVKRGAFDADVAYIEVLRYAAVPRVLSAEEFREIAESLTAWNYWCASHFLRHVRVGDRVLEYSVVRASAESLSVVIRTDTAYLVFDGPETVEGCEVIR